VIRLAGALIRLIGRVAGLMVLTAVVVAFLGAAAGHVLGR